ncbi:GNAT family N-acetyltransferase [Pseudoalteromonas denitrificans]|uniref:Acetyltransferase (GNAT) domain-containing protein n=1 Tax=Pseudoalteromonas denitrificans DSM 6059 TaxID=1123010 RepID=A0A1I1SUN8_9GAMM|nr:GNAT family N-acetyltransferase [Pseudoalteromonas denitrificans]SFD50177.1 Acetyltransferase (GNAT) domain-containing protein [Pseudoalteromonas denitrificans DSM 6059]
MIKNKIFESFTFETARLKISNVRANMELGTSKPELRSSIIRLLTPSVVKSLPPYFHDIKTEIHADAWLTKMLTESHLYMISHNDSKAIIGFLFLFESDNTTAHLGYLLGENFWSQGFGSELLFGLIENCRTEQLIKKLIGGVDIENTASAKLLEKVGFVASSHSDTNTIFYEYTF